MSAVGLLISCWRYLHCSLSLTLFSSVHRPLTSDTMLSYSQERPRTTTCLELDVYWCTGNTSGVWHKAECLETSSFNNISHVSHLTLHPITARYILNNMFCHMIPHVPPVLNCIPQKPFFEKRATITQSTSTALLSHLPKNTCYYRMCS